MSPVQTTSPHQQIKLDAVTLLPSLPPDDLRVVALAASAGGLQALSLILSGLPPEFPAAIVIVQHLSPDFPSRMPSILGRSTCLPIKEAREGDALQAGHVFLAPPGKHLLVNPDFTLSLSLAAKEHHSRPSADVLFRSVADSCGSQAIGVVLTGGDSDGSAGIQAIKAAGGVTMAQDQPSSQHPSMPRNAAATGDVDYVLPLPGIAAALVALMRLKKAPEPGGEDGSDRRNGRAQGCTRQERIAALVVRAKAIPTAPGLLEEAVIELASCAEALRVMEEALRVQSGVIESYNLTFMAEAALLGQ